MDYEQYQQAYFTRPVPDQRFAFRGILGITLYFQEYQTAVEYYQKIFGMPAYVEGNSTRGWQIGDTWLTLLRGKKGFPQNVEVMLYVQDPTEVDCLRAAFVDAGGQCQEPLDTLMYEPIRLCAVQDPFGTNFMIVSNKGD